MMYVIMIFIFFSSWIAHSGQSSTGQVKKAQVPVYSNPYESSSIMCLLQKGDKVQLKSREGRFWAVSNPCLSKNESMGYIGFSNVFRTPEINTREELVLKKSLTLSNENQEAINVRQRSSNAVMGVRGLDDGENDLNSASKVTPDIKSVERMEDRKPRADDLRRIENGILKESEKVK